MSTIYAYNGDTLLPSLGAAAVSRYSIPKKKKEGIL